MRRVVVFTLAAAVATFCVVQDRVTAAGARRYVATQRAALAAGEPPVNIDKVMDPAIRRSVLRGLAWSGSVALAGLAGAALLAPRRPSPQNTTSGAGRRG
jgi:hypothetical protein